MIICFCLAHINQHDHKIVFITSEFYTHQTQGCGTYAQNQQYMERRHENFTQIRSLQNISALCINRFIEQKSLVCNCVLTNL